jgi:hypothetical protein
MLRDINLWAEREMAFEADPVRDWITDRVEPTYGSYDAWTEAVKRYDDD